MRDRTQYLQCGVTLMSEFIYKNNINTIFIFDKILDNTFECVGQVPPDVPKLLIDNDIGCIKLGSY